jgi:hypothetical protein
MGTHIGAHGGEGLTHWGSGEHSAGIIDAKSPYVPLHIRGCGDAYLACALHHYETRGGIDHLNYIPGHALDIHTCALHVRFIADVYTAYSRSWWGCEYGK